MYLLENINNIFESSENVLLDDVCNLIINDFAENFINKKSKYCWVKTKENDVFSHSIANKMMVKDDRKLYYDSFKLFITDNLKHIKKYKNLDNKQLNKILFNEISCFCTYNFNLNRIFKQVNDIEKYKNIIQKFKDTNLNEKRIYLMLRAFSGGNAMDFAHDDSFTKNYPNTGFIAISFKNDSNILDKNTLLKNEKLNHVFCHEFRHILDIILKQDISEKHYEYSHIKNYDGFCYLTNPSELNANFNGSRKFLNKEENIKILKKIFNNDKKQTYTVIEIADILNEYTNKFNVKKIFSKDYKNFNKKLQNILKFYNILKDIKSFKNWLDEQKNDEKDPIKDIIITTANNMSVENPEDKWNENTDKFINTVFKSVSKKYMEIITDLLEILAENIGIKIKI